VSGGSRLVSSIVWLTLWGMLFAFDNVCCFYLGKPCWTWDAWVGEVVRRAGQ
jgi:hypothetical protein